MIGVDACEDCRRCEGCGRHLTPEDQWPCLECGDVLCASCECTRTHVMEPCS